MTKRPRSAWKVAEAKAHFSDVIRAAGKEPQVILKRDRAVAAVIDWDSLAEFEAWQRANGSQSLAEATEGLRRACAEEGYTLPAPKRRDRRNDFLDVLAQTHRPR